MPWRIAASEKPRGGVEGDGLKDSDQADSAGRNEGITAVRHFSAQGGRRRQRLQSRSALELLPERGVVLSQALDRPPTRRYAPEVGNAILT